ncbi:hypothetical protein D8B26_002210 [Coccidioides posadasii str. Silveira]|uniref:ATPase, AAA family protein n=1 Tax=Coccidioides posadasii (strain C735) TaxID=222929 RepID=C5PHN6_COCP7|nr:ATPase, AAA family protein [Coccidioides posadasii C735 delta SOWgp]EER24039.1 ATPase, AAA family protein [Coccidioides posadasii C735 delta SOWgp]QVM07511.1 hypothetical protein D8B26_002210 [Coccidioides posadasii str. Silveira]|eukprot:XP_003066184.1 ATPase, AAA family protein [Coccidioides posadasii C735 delta SOWgp]
MLDKGLVDHVLADIKTYLKGRSCPPGTGKSSLAFVIASELQLDIYTLSLNSSGLDEEQLVALFHAIPKHCIVLLEDVNCSGISREHSDSAANAEMKDKTSGGLTLSSLLNALDGPATPEGYILIVTINYREKLDKALIRPGWVDMEVPFSYADKDMIRDLFSCLYLAMEFTSQVPGGKFTAAEIQGYLLRHMGSPEDAVKGAKKWARNLLSEKQAG